MIPVGHVRLDGDRRERRRVDLCGRGRGCRRLPGRRPRGPVHPADDDPGSDERRPPRRPALAQGTDGAAPVPGAGTSRSRIGRAAQTTTRPASRATLVPNSLVCGAISRVLATPTSTPNSDATDPPGGHRLRVGDHEEQEDQHLRGGHDHPPEVEPAHGRERPAGGHAVPGRRERSRGRRPSVTQNEAARPSRRRRAGDQQPAAEDDRVGGDHPGVERSPPEVERLDPAAAQHDEGDDQPDVRRVEDVGAAVADDVLREQREGGDAGEHVPLVEAPRDRRPASPATRRIEGDAAAGEHARWPARRRPGGRGRSAPPRSRHR